MTTQPAFDTRGFMLDVTRGRVPTRETLEVYVDLLSACGYNQLELYLEHAFAHEGEEAVWGDASPITPDDMRWLDARCTARGITLVPNRNCLGHMEAFLAADGHAHRAERPDGFELWGRHNPPTTLAVTDDNLAFVQRLLEELASCTTARAINIGMDEPWEFGTGASRELVESRPAGEVYRDWVLKVARPWLDRGYRVEMWADILGHHPEQAEHLPDGLIMVAWTYDSPAYVTHLARRDGREVPERPGFGQAALPLARYGKTLWVAPGTGVWNSVSGRLDCAVDNMRDAASVGLEAGATGFLLTSWGDNGNWEGPIQTFVPVIYGGLAARLGADAPDLADLDAIRLEVSRTLFGRDDHAGADLLVGLGMLTSLLGCPVENATLFFRALIGHGLDEQPTAEALDRVRAEVGRLRGVADGLEPAGWVEEVRTVLDLVDVTVRRLSGEEAPVSRAVLEQHVRNWLSTARPGGLRGSLAKLQTGQDDVEALVPDEVPVQDEGYWRGILGR